MSYFYNYDGDSEGDEDPIPGFSTHWWSNRRGDVGKVLTDGNEPGIETHLHRHPDGITISTYRDGQKPERYNFSTGEQESR